MDWVLRNRGYRLILSARRVEGGLLKGPDRLEMGKRVPETLNDSVQVRLETLQGSTIFEGTGYHTGLEEVDDLTQLLGE